LVINTFTDSFTMTDETTDLFIAHEEESQQIQNAFDDYCEEMASKLEITVDYFIAEFL
jgi:hypothetical protein